MSMLIKRDDSISIDFFCDKNILGIENLIRICMTDIVSTKMAVVVEEDISPGDYAGILSTENFDNLYDNFFHDTLSTINFKNIVNDKKMYPEVFQSFIYDQIPIASSLFRLASVRPITEESISDVFAQDSYIFASSILSILMHYNREFKQSSLSGLTYFSVITEIFIELYTLVDKRLDPIFLRRFTSCIADITKHNWILYDTNWYTALFNKSNRLSVFRRFLFLSLIGSITSTDTIEHIYETKYSNLESDMIEFIDLRESSDTTYDDIVLFLDRIERHNPNIQRQFLFQSLMEFPFYVFKDVYNQTYSTSENALLEDQRDYLTMLSHSLENALGAAWDPDSVLTGENDPVSYMTDLLLTHCDTIVTGPISEHYVQLGIDIPIELDRSSEIFKGSVRDLIMMVLVYNRYELVEQNTGLDNVTAKAHILLIIGDEPMGLSIASWVIPYYVRQNFKILTASNLDIISHLVDGLNKINFAFPYMMPDIWVAILNDKGILNDLRLFLFTFVESLSIRGESTYRDYLGMDKDTWFEYVERIASILNSDTPSESELRILLSSKPILREAVVLSELDAEIWTEAMAGDLSYE